MLLGSRGPILLRADRLFPVRGRREQTSSEERIVFYENPRDPEINAALASACAQLNKRRLERQGRRLRYEVEQAIAISTPGGPVRRFG